MTMAIKQELVSIAEKDMFPPRALMQLYMTSGVTPENHINPVTHIAFSGYNLYQLEIEYIKNGYKSAEWSTFAQYKQLKKQIKKGSKGTHLTLAVHKKDEEGQEHLQFFKGYTVFNKQQVKED